MQDRHARRVVLQNVGGKHPRRHLAQRGLHGGRDLRHRHVDLDVRMEIDADGGVAEIRLRFDVFNVVDVGRQGALEIGGDALFHLLGSEPGI